MKTSYYNYLIDNGNDSILYNCYTDELLLMLPDVLSIYKDNVAHPERIKDIHPSFFQYLRGKGFLVDDEKNEQESIIANWEKTNNESRTFSITINPTLDCNMKCWYCYEKHTSNKMAEDISLSVLRLLERINENSRYDNIILSFFGGEPLFYFEDVVKPLIDKVSLVCYKNKKTFKLHFTTNGSLLNDTIFKYLNNYDVSFQITLDGNEKLHNLVKSTKNGENNYQIVVHNIKKALSDGHMVSVRLNYVAKNLPCFLDIVSDFQAVSVEDRNKLSFNFQRVWQDHIGSRAEVQATVKDLEKIFRDAGFKVISSVLNSTGRCYADDDNNVVINYDGQIFKCTARDFVTENSEGYITDKGELCWNERHYKRVSIVYGNNNCKKCKIYPLCHGGCSQQKLEVKKLENICIKNYTEEDKSKFVADRIQDLLVLNSENKNIAK